MVLDVDSQRDGLVGGDYNSADRKARRVNHIAYYEGLDTVTDTRQAIVAGRTPVGE